MSFLNRTEGAEDAWEWESEGVPAEAQFPWKSGRAFPGGAGGGRALRRGEKGWNGPADDGLASEKKDFPVEGYKRSGRPHTSERPPTTATAWAQLSEAARTRERTTLGWGADGGEDGASGRKAWLSGGRRPVARGQRPAREPGEARSRMDGCRAGGGLAGCRPAGLGGWLSGMRRSPSLTRARPPRRTAASERRRAEVKGVQEMVSGSSPLVMVISVSLRVVLATHVYHDVTGGQFFGVPGPHDLCVLQGTQEVRGRLGSRGRRGARARPAPEARSADRTRYSGRRRSKAHARASSQWKVPLCVPIRGGAMWLPRGRLDGGTYSRLSVRGSAREGGGRSSSRGRRPRRERWPISLPPHPPRGEAGHRPGRGRARSVPFPLDGSHGNRPQRPGPLGTSPQLPERLRVEPPR